MSFFYFQFQTTERYKRNFYIQSKLYYRNYGTVIHIRRNCRNYGRNPLRPVVISALEYWNVISGTRNPASPRPKWRSNARHNRPLWPDDSKFGLKFARWRWGSSWPLNCLPFINLPWALRSLRSNNAAGGWPFTPQG